MFYSAQTRGFYDHAIHGANIPTDAVEITREEHAALIAGQAAGRIIAADSDRRPVLVDPPPPTPEEIQRQIAAAIDAHVEAQALSLQYNSAAHLVGYVASTVSHWRAEAEAFVSWRDAVWMAAITEQAEAMETGNVPSVDDVIEALPKWSGV
jgi:hypothetical protein